MINIIKARDQIKRMNDGEVRRVATGQSPLGGMGALLATAEIKDRNDQRQEYEAGMAGQRPQTTVVEDVLKGGGAPSPRPTPSLSPLGAGGLGAPPPLGGATQRQMSRPAVPQQMAQAAPRPMPQAMPQPRPAAMPAQMPMPMPQRAQEGGIVYAQTGWPVDTRGGLGSILNFFAEKRRRKHPSQMTAEELRAQEAELALAGEVPRELEIPTPPVLSQLQSKLTGAPSELQLQWGQRQTPVADPALPPVETVTTTAPSPDTHRQAMLDVLSGKSGSLSQFSSDAAHQEALLNAMSGGQHMQPTDISGPSFAEAWLPQGTGGGYYFDKLKKALVGLTPAGQQRMLETHALSQQPTAIASLSDEQRRISQIPGRVISPVGAVSRHAVGADEFAVNPFAAGDPDMGAVNANMTTLASATPSSTGASPPAADEQAAERILTTARKAAATLTPDDAKSTGDKLLEGGPLHDSSQRLQAMLEESQAESKAPAKAPTSLVQQYKDLMADYASKGKDERINRALMGASAAMLGSKSPYLSKALGAGLTGWMTESDKYKKQVADQQKAMMGWVGKQAELDILSRKAGAEEMRARGQVGAWEAQAQKWRDDLGIKEAEIKIKQLEADTRAAHQQSLESKETGRQAEVSYMVKSICETNTDACVFDEGGEPTAKPHTLALIYRTIGSATPRTGTPAGAPHISAMQNRYRLSAVGKIPPDSKLLGNKDKGWTEIIIDEKTGEPKSGDNLGTSAEARRQAAASLKSAREAWAMWQTERDIARFTGDKTGGVSSLDTSNIARAFKKVDGKVTPVTP